jgi:hypothetical protein
MTSSFIVVLSAPFHRGAPVYMPIPLSSACSARSGSPGRRALADNARALDGTGEFRHDRFTP